MSKQDSTPAPESNEEKREESAEENVSLREFYGSYNMSTIDRVNGWPMIIPHSSNDICLVGSTFEFTSTDIDDSAVVEFSAAIPFEFSIPMLANIAEQISKTAKAMARGPFRIHNFAYDNDVLKAACRDAIRHIETIESLVSEIVADEQTTDDADE